MKWRLISIGRRRRPSWTSPGPLNMQGRRIAGERHIGNKLALSYELFGLAPHSL